MFSSVRTGHVGGRSSETTPRALCEVRKEGRKEGGIRRRGGLKERISVRKDPHAARPH